MYMYMYIYFFTLLLFIKTECTLKTKIKRRICYSHVNLQLQRLTATINVECVTN